MVKTEIVCQNASKIEQVIGMQLAIKLGNSSFTEDFILRNTRVAVSQPYHLRALADAFLP